MTGNPFAVARRHKNHRTLSLPIHHRRKDHMSTATPERALVATKKKKRKVCLGARVQGVPA